MNLSEGSQRAASSQMSFSRKSKLLWALVMLFVGTAIVKHGLLTPLANIPNQLIAFSDNALTEAHITAALDIVDVNIKSAMNVSVEGSKNFILVVTSWRSGSTFFGEVVASHPSVFLHYEPLWHLGVRQIRGGVEADEAAHHLKSLLHCRYLQVNNLALKLVDGVRCRFDDDQYNVAIDKLREGLMKSNVNAWNACIRGPNRKVCFMPSFLERACNKFPTVVAKIVRLRLNLTRSLLEDPDLHRMKIVYLVRDPRATWLSRKVLRWCRASRDCIDPKLLCDDIDSDLDAMRELSSAYPDRVMLVKYETLAADPLKTFESIFRFSGLSFLPSINETIRRRSSRKSADRWRTKLNQSEIDYIERGCMNVINRLNRL